MKDKRVEEVPLSGSQRRLIKRSKDSLKNNRKSGSRR
jgi:hypothetical protein